MGDDEHEVGYRFCYFCNEANNVSSLLLNSTTVYVHFLPGFHSIVWNDM